MRAHQFIIESLDTNIDYTIIQNTYSIFKTKATINGTEVRFDASSSHNYEGEYWYVNFSRFNGHVFSYERTETGDGLTVFSFVKQSMTDFIKVKDPDCIKFAADKFENRTKLYTRLLKKYAGQFGYNFKLSDTPDQDIFTLTKSDSLSEAPLPPEWDKSKFNQEDNIYQMADYARSMATELGVGSSRVAVEIPYNGTATVLKVALNNKGLAQNKEEARILATPWIQQSGKVIPLIDYDTEHDSPSWIHVMKALPLSREDEEKWFEALWYFKKYFDSAKLDNDGINDIVNMLRYRWSDYGNVDAKIKKFVSYADFISNLGNQFNVKLSDIQSRRNWGMYKGKPVLIDLGLTDSTYNLHYRNRNGT